MTTGPSYRERVVEKVNTQDRAVNMVRVIENTDEDTAL
jgi:hypothetical protein